MIEILPGVFYDPTKGWYEQDAELIILGEQVMQEPPISAEMEDVLGGGQRLITGTWEAITECGIFNMTVAPQWQYGAMTNSFESRVLQDVVTVLKIS
jgi:hypothetical protein